MKYRSKNNVLKLAVVILISSFILLGMGIFLMFKDSKETNINLMDLDYQYLSTNDVGEYVISDADVNINFEVTDGTDFKILDENNKEVEVKIIGNKIINSNGYEKGKKYTLSIENGSFVSEQLKETTEVTFKITRDEVKEYKVKDEVVKVENKDVQVVDNKLITSNTSYKVGEVVVIYDGDEIKDAYVVSSIDEQGSYNVTDATIEQIYSELDFYYEEHLDLSDYKIDEQIKEYIVASAQKSTWYEAIVETVHAEPKLEVSLKNDGNDIIATITVKVSAGDDSVLLSSKYHDFEFTYKQTLRLDALVDITLTNWDIVLQLSTGQEFGLKISNDIIDYDGTKNKELMAKIQEAINNKTATDKDDNEVEVVEIPIKTAVPGLTVDLELKLVNEIDMSIDFSTSFKSKNVLTVGIDYGWGEKFKPSGSYEYEVVESTLEYSGNLETKIGVELAGNIDFIGVVEAELGVSTGLYGEASLTYKEDYVASETTFTNEMELGLYIEAEVEFKVAGYKDSIDIIDEKLAIYENSWDHKEKIEKPTNKVTFNTNGGNKIESQEIVQGELIKKPQVPTKEGYVFAYWELDGVEFDFTQQITDDIELKAVWKGNEIVIEGYEYDDKVSFIDYNQCGDGYQTIVTYYYKNGKIVKISNKITLSGDESAYDWYLNKVNNPGVYKNPSYDKNVVYYELVNIQYFQNDTNSKESVISNCTGSNSHLFNCEIVDDASSKDDNNSTNEQSPEIDNTNKPSDIQISSEAQTSIDYDDKIAFIDHDSSSDEDGNKYTYIAIIYYKNGDVVGVGIKIIFEDQKAAEAYYNKNKLNSSDSSVVRHVSLEDNILYFEPVDISTFSILTKSMVIFTCNYSNCEVIE